MVGISMRGVIDKIIGKSEETAVAPSETYIKAIPLKAYELSLIHISEPTRPY